MNYEERYKQALERARELYDNLIKEGTLATPKGIESIFPELRDSEDERIRKELIERFNWELKGAEEQDAAGCSRQKDIAMFKRGIAWLEKQGEHANFRNKIQVGDKVTKNEDGVLVNISQLKRVAKPSEKSADKVEPKFKVGDWITNGIDFTFQVCSIEDNMYLRSDDYLIDIETADKTFRLWTIQDAKDGDMLANEEMIVIFKHFEEPSYRQHIVAYIGLDTSGNIQITDETWTLGIDKAKPATKEQCDLLFQKMKEAGYEWDDEKKELKKIEQSCYHNDGLYYAKEILEKTFGKVEGYQSDDGKMEHQAAIETVNALYHKKSAWSEEDEDGGIEETEDDVTI